MRIKIKYLGYLTDLAGKQYDELEINGNKKVEDLIPFLKKLRSDDYILIINGKGAKADTEVKDGDNIVVLPQTGGG
ncbi:MAG: MoaD/ThiS family protein [Caldisphaera sp.]|nr:MoaD/ThiS family protein [Caldisphaera sp.]